MPAPATDATGTDLIQLYVFLFNRIQVNSADPAAGPRRKLATPVHRGDGWRSRITISSGRA
jgi:hypothetical protein